MKVKIDIECTPIEARTLLGLPDVEPLQKALMKQMEEKMSGAMNIMDPEAFTRQWAPLGLQSIEQFQKMLWGAARKVLNEDLRGTKSDPEDKS